jgi:hypothetical protein
VRNGLVEKITEDVAAVSEILARSAPTQTKEAAE